MDAGGAADESAYLRTAKSCGPDAPTLASSSREANFLRATVANKPGHRGEREISCLNHCAGNAGLPPLNLYARVRFFCALLHTRPRVQRAPGVPCAL